MAKKKKETSKKTKKKAAKRPVGKAATGKKAWKPTAVSTKTDFVTQLKESIESEVSIKVANDLFDKHSAILGISIKKNGRFIVTGFGTFNVKKRKARKGRNPQTGKTMMIKASKTVSFKPAPKYKATLQLLCSK